MVLHAVLWLHVVRQYVFHAISGVFAADVSSRHLPWMMQATMRPTQLIAPGQTTISTGELRDCVGIRKETPRVLPAPYVEEIGED